MNNRQLLLGTLLTDDVVWEHLQSLVKEYDPELEEKHKAYLEALEKFSSAGGDAMALDQAYRAAIASDALFAFQKGLEANLSHFRYPHMPHFIGMELENMHQEHVMRTMPKRVAADIVHGAIEKDHFTSDQDWCQAIREYTIALEVMVPKLMHFEGYKAGNTWFGLTVPGYAEDQALTSAYQMQISQYFGG